MLQKADLRDVTFADLQALQDNQIPESHTLDFKRDFPFDKDARASLAADIVAFANTRGGDLILGVAEQGGVISEFKPIEFDDADKALLMLQSAFADLIEPKVPGVHLQAVAVPEGGYIVVVRAPQSFQAPHRVRKNGVFYSRTSTGIDPMDITTLRSAFLRSETAIEKVRAFQSDRASSLRMLPLPAPLRAGAIGVLHVVPLASVLGSLNFDVHTLDSIARTLGPLIRLGGWGSRINLDGAMSVSSAQDEETPSYTQLFRNGIIESVMSLQYVVGSLAWPDAMRDELTTGHHEALKDAHAKLGIDGPAFVMLSFVDIGGAPLELGNTIAAIARGGAATVPAYHANLLLPELFVESFTSSTAEIYGSLFDMVWNAAGRTGRPSQRR